MSGELRFPPAIQAMFDDPAYWVSNRAHRALDDALDHRFRGALAHAVENTPGLTARFLNKSGALANLPWLAWEDDPLGGYWIGKGIVHAWPETDPARWPTFLWANYLRAEGDDQCSERVPGGIDRAMVRDPRALVELTLGMVKAHRQLRAATR